MSSGIQDANAVGQLGQKVVLACYDLRDAIKAADAGYRGLSPAWNETVNEILLEAGYELRKVTSR